MTGFRSAFENPFSEDEIGLFTGTSTYKQFRDRPGKLFRLKAQSANIGSFFIGTFTGSFDGFGVGQRIAFELDAGDDTGWFVLGAQNLNALYGYNPSGSVDKLAYWIQR